MKRLIPILAAMLMMAGCHTDRTETLTDGRPASTSPEADSLLMLLTEQQKNPTITYSALAHTARMLCEIADTRPGDPILQMRRVQAAACTLAVTRRGHVAEYIESQMSGLDSAASPMDWYMLRNQRLAEEKGLYQQYKEASENLDYFRSQGSEAGMAKSYELLASALGSMNQYSESRKYLDEAQRYYQATNDRRALLQIELKKAEADREGYGAEHLRELLENEEIRQNSRLNFQVCQLAFLVYDSVECLDQAIVQLEKGEEVDRSYLPVPLALKAVWTLKNGDLDGALRLVWRIRNEHTDSTLLSINREFVHTTMAYVYKYAGEKDSCINEMALSSYWSDRTLSDANLPAVYAHEAEEMIAMARRNSQLERQRLLLWWGVSTLLLVIVIIAIWHFARRRHQRIQAEQALLEQQIEQGERVQLVQGAVLEQSGQLIAQLDRVLDEHTDAAADRLTAEVRRLLSLYKSEEEGRQGYLQMNTEIDSRFITRLKADYPDMPEKMLRLAALIASGADGRQLAAILNISSQSVYTGRYRLRTRLGLSKDASLEEYLRKYL